jgi:E3 ubiquitin-protein ligase BOI-like protein
VPGPSHRGGGQLPSLNVALFNESQNEIGYNLLGSRKRAREGEDTLAATHHHHRQQQQQQQHQQQQHQHRVPSSVEYRQQQSRGSAGAMVMPQTTGAVGVVSTGLRLAFEDERLNSTTSASTSERVAAAADASRSLLYAAGEDLNTQLQQQREEIEQFFKMQVQHFPCFPAAAAAQFS